MKKSLLIILVALLLLPIINVNAAAPVITETSYSNGRITIKGTGDGEVQIVLFGKDNLPVYMTTVTAENGVFLVALPSISGLEEGTYNIKTSNYSGEETSTGTVVVTAEPNPPTSDNITLYVVLGTTSLIGIVALSTYVYKISKRKKDNKKS